MRLVATVLLVFSMPAPAAATCFEDLGQLGCPNLETFPVDDLRRLSCQNLWYVRNSIYNERGYCFRTKAAIEQFDNSDCSVSDAAQLQFNQHEEANISRIVRVEREKGCR